MKQRDILFLLASFCIIVFAWVAFNVIHSSITSTINASTNEAILPIDPNFDTTTLKKMKTRIVVNPAFTISVVPTITITPPPPTPVPLLEVPIGSESAKTASGGGFFQ